MAFGKRLFLAALLCAAQIVPAAAAPAAGPARWSRAIVKALPRAAAFAKTSAARDLRIALDEIPEFRDPARREELLAPLVGELKKKHHGPRSLAKRPKALARAIDAYAMAVNERARELYSEAGDGGISDLRVEDNARDIDTLLLRLYPYLSQENRFQLDDIYDGVQAQALRIGRLAELQRPLAEREARRGYAERLVDEALGYPPDNFHVTASQLPPLETLRDAAKQAFYLAGEYAEAANPNNPKNVAMELEGLGRLLEAAYREDLSSSAEAAVSVALAKLTRTTLLRTLSTLENDDRFDDRERREMRSRAEGLLHRLLTRPAPPPPDGDDA